MARVAKPKICPVMHEELAERLMWHLARLIYQHLVTPGGVIERLGKALRDYEKFGDK